MQSERKTFIDFNDTGVAFRDHSTNSLKQIYVLFKVMNNRAWMNLSKHLIDFAFTAGFPVKGLIKKTLYRHFVGGTSLEDSINVVERLARRNVCSIMDYAQEGEESEDMFDATCREVIRTVEFAR